MRKIAKERNLSINIDQLEKDWLNYIEDLEEESRKKKGEKRYKIGRKYGKNKEAL